MVQKEPNPREEQPKPRGRAALPVRTGRFIRDYLEKYGEGYLSEIHSSLKSEIGKQNLLRPKAKWLGAPTYESFVKYFGHLRRLGMVELVREEPTELVPHNKLLSIRDRTVVASTRRVYRLSALGRTEQMAIVWEDPLLRGLMRQFVLGLMAGQKQNVETRNGD